MTNTKVMAVIHHMNDGTSLDNAAIAVEAGCAGVFLIEMNGRDEMIDGPAIAIKTAFSHLIVGCNRLRTHPTAALRTDCELGIDATWCDNPGVYSTGVEALAGEIAQSLDAVRMHRPDYLYFGSVAFKTQDIDPNPPAAAILAADLGWIPTTSGIKTGVAPDLSKLAGMKGALDNRPLAVASGVSPANVAEIAPHVDWILVATGVSADFYHFDAAKLRAVVSACNSL